MKRHKTKKLMILILLTTVMLALLAAAAACVEKYRHHEKAEEKMETAEKAAPRPIPAAAAQSFSGAETREYPGVLRAAHRVTLAFNVSGKLEFLMDQNGHCVTSGMCLASLDARDFARTADAARADYERDKLQWQRLSHLRGSKAVAEVDYEAGEAAYRRSAAALKIREKAFRDTRLIAPFDGIVIGRRVENHEYVQTGQPVLTLQNTNELEVSCLLPEKRIADVTGGKFPIICSIHFDTDPVSNRWCQAKLREYALDADPVTRTYETVFTVVPPPAISVCPGMTAGVRLQTPPHRGKPQTVLVPVEALCRRPDGCVSVWVIAPQGGAPEEREITLVSLRRDRAEISGVSPGEYVATAGVHALTRHDNVRPMAAGREGLDG